MNVPMNRPIVTWVTQSWRKRYRRRGPNSVATIDSTSRATEKISARVVDAAHRQPRRDVVDPVRVEDVGDQCGAESSHHSASEVNERCARLHLQAITRTHEVRHRSCNAPPANAKNWHQVIGLVQQSFKNPYHASYLVGCRKSSAVMANDVYSQASFA